MCLLSPGRRDAVTVSRLGSCHHFTYRSPGVLPAGGAETQLQDRCWLMAARDVVLTQSLPEALVLCLLLLRRRTGL